MQARVTIAGVTSFVQGTGVSFNIQKGKDFSLDMIPGTGDPPTIPPLTWAHIGEQVLDLTNDQQQTHVDVNAHTVGTGRVFLVDSTLKSYFNLTIVVVEEIGGNVPAVFQMPPGAEENDTSGNE